MEVSEASETLIIEMSIMENFHEMPGGLVGFIQRSSKIIGNRMKGNRYKLAYSWNSIGSDKHVAKRNKGKHYGSWLADL